MAQAKVSDKPSDEKYILQQLRKYAERNSFDGVRDDTLFNIEEKIGYFTPSQRDLISIEGVSLTKFLKKIDDELKIRGTRKRTAKETIKFSAQISQRQQIRTAHSYIESEKSDILGLREKTAKLVGASAETKMHELGQKASKAIVKFLLTPDKSTKGVFLKFDSLLTAHISDARKAFKDYLSKKIDKSILKSKNRVKILAEVKRLGRQYEADTGIKLTDKEIYGSTFYKAAQ